jgi:H+/Cl- antiporter ClcA
MLAQTFTTPDTASYLYLGLGVFFGLMGLYALSLVLRARNLRRDEAVIEQLQSEN